MSHAERPEAVPDNSGLFDPALYAAVRRPLLEAETPPAWVYTSPVFYQREVERIFRREWQFIGRSEQLAKPGDYLSIEYAGVPIVIVRGQDGAVRAFANTCRHRGSLLLDEGQGQCKAIVCPYHSWTYALDGRLAGTPDMDRTEGFRADDYPLLPVRLETWAGFMFINFAIADPVVAQRMRELGAIPIGSSADDLGKFWRGEMETWRTLIEGLKIVLD